MCAATALILRLSRLDKQLALGLAEWGCALLPLLYLPMLQTRPELWPLRNTQAQMNNQVKP